MTINRVHIDELIRRYQGRIRKEQRTRVALPLDAWRQTIPEFRCASDEQLAAIYRQMNSHAQSLRTRGGHEFETTIRQFLSDAFAPLELRSKRRLPGTTGSVRPDAELYGTRGVAFFSIKRSTRERAQQWGAELDAMQRYHDGQDQTLLFFGLTDEERADGRLLFNLPKDVKYVPFRDTAAVISMIEEIEAKIL